MNFVYVTRHFNHSGYLILKRLIEEGLRPSVVVVREEASPLLSHFRRPFALAAYKLECGYYRCTPLKTTNSEELLAKSKGITVWRISSIKDDSFYEKLQALKPDLIVVGGGWHELIPERVFSLPPLGCINTHPSLLPLFRGTSITRWQVLYGVTRSGCSIQYIDKGFDTGGIIAQREVEVSANDSPQALFYKLGLLAADMMIDILRWFMEQGRQPTQNPISTTNGDDQNAYFRRWSWDKTCLKINWQIPLVKTHAFVKANTQESYKYLGPLCLLNGREYIIRETEVEAKQCIANLVHENIKTGYGYIAWINNYLCVWRDTEKYCLIIKKVQRGGKYYRYRRAHTVRNALGGMLSDKTIEEI